MLVLIVSRRVREVQCEINCMHDTKDFKVAEAMHSAQLSHVPSESSFFLPQDDRGGLLGRTRVLQPNFCGTQCTSGNVVASPLVYPSTSFARISTPRDNPDEERDFRT